MCVKTHVAFLGFEALCRYQAVLFRKMVSLNIPMQSKQPFIVSFASERREQHTELVAV